MPNDSEGGSGRPAMIALDHVAIPVSDVGRATAFYRDVLGLEEITRPPFDVPGSWFRLGDRELHLIAHPHSTFRTGKGVDSRDIHFAIRTDDFARAVAHLESCGYRTDVPRDDPRWIKVSPAPTAGFPQIFIMDPDRNVIEINVRPQARASIADG